MVTRIGPKSPHRMYLAEWREKRFLTQEQLALRLDSTKATVSRWETGDRDPPLRALAALADALSIPLASLFIDPERPSADAILSETSPRVARLAFKVVSDMVDDEKKDGTNG